MVYGYHIGVLHRAVASVLKRGGGDTKKVRMLLRDIIKKVRMLLHDIIEKVHMLLAQREIFEKRP